MLDFVGNSKVLSNSFQQFPTLFQHTFLYKCLFFNELDLLDLLESKIAYILTALKKIKIKTAVESRQNYPFHPYLNEGLQGSLQRGAAAYPSQQRK